MRKIVVFIIIFASVAVIAFASNSDDGSVAMPNDESGVQVPEG